MYLTDDGRLLPTAVLPEHQRLMSTRFSSLSHAETWQLLTLLRKLDEGDR